MDRMKYLLPSVPEAVPAPAPAAEELLESPTPLLSTGLARDPLLSKFVSQQVLHSDQAVGLSSVLRGLLPASADANSKTSVARKAALLFFFEALNDEATGAAAELLRSGDPRLARSGAYLGAVAASGHGAGTPVGLGGGPAPWVRPAALAPFRALAVASLRDPSADPAASRAALFLLAALGRRGPAERKEMVAAIQRAIAAADAAAAGADEEADEEVGRAREEAERAAKEAAEAKAAAEEAADPKKARASAGDDGTGLDAPADGIDALTLADQGREAAAKAAAAAQAVAALAGEKAASYATRLRDALAAARKRAASAPKRPPAAQDWSLQHSVFGAVRAGRAATGADAVSRACFVGVGSPDDTGARHALALAALVAERDPAGAAREVSAAVEDAAARHEAALGDATALGPPEPGSGLNLRDPLARVATARLCASVLHLTDGRAGDPRGAGAPFWALLVSLAVRDRADAVRFSALEALAGGSGTGPAAGLPPPADHHEARVRAKHVDARRARAWRLLAAHASQPVRVPSAAGGGGATEERPLLDVVVALLALALRRPAEAARAAAAARAAEALARGAAADARARGKGPGAGDAAGTSAHSPAATRALGALAEAASAALDAPRSAGVGAAAARALLALRDAVPAAARLTPGRLRDAGPAAGAGVVLALDARSVSEALDPRAAHEMLELAEAAAEAAPSAAHPSWLQGLWDAAAGITGGSGQALGLAYARAGTRQGPDAGAFAAAAAASALRVAAAPPPASTRLPPGAPADAVRNAAAADAAWRALQHGALAWLGERGNELAGERSGRPSLVPRALLQTSWEAAGSVGRKAPSEDGGEGGSDADRGGADSDDPFAGESASESGEGFVVGRPEAVDRDVAAGWVEVDGEGGARGATSSSGGEAAGKGGGEGTPGEPAAAAAAPVAPAHIPVDISAAEGGAAGALREAQRRGAVLSAVLSTLRAAALTEPWPLRAAATRSLATLAVRSPEPFRLLAYRTLAALAADPDDALGVAAAAAGPVRVLDAIYASQVALERLVARHGRARAGWPAPALRALRAREAELEAAIRRQVCLAPADSYCVLGPAAAELLGAGGPGAGLGRTPARGEPVRSPRARGDARDDDSSTDAASEDGAPRLDKADEVDAIVGDVLEERLRFAKQIDAAVVHDKDDLVEKALKSTGASRWESDSPWDGGAGGKSWGAADDDGPASALGHADLAPEDAWGAPADSPTAGGARDDAWAGAGDGDGDAAAYRRPSPSPPLARQPSDDPFAASPRHGDPWGAASPRAPDDPFAASPRAGSLAASAASPRGAAAPAVRRGVVLHMFVADASEPDELSVFEGDELEILEESDDWFVVSDSAGRRGLVPASYVRVESGAAGRPAGGGDDRASARNFSHQASANHRQASLVRRASSGTPRATSLTRRAGSGTAGRSNSQLLDDVFSAGGAAVGRAGANGGFGGGSSAYGGGFGGGSSAYGGGFDGGFGDSTYDAGYDQPPVQTRQGSFAGGASPRAGSADALEPRARSMLGRPSGLGRHDSLDGSPARASPRGGTARLIATGFEGEMEEELTVRPGEEVKVYTEEDGWARVLRLADGATGLVPTWALG